MLLLGLDAHHNTQNHARIIQNAIKAGLITGEPVVPTEPQPLTVKFEVRAGVATVVEKPPEIEVEIIYPDVREVRKKKGHGSESHVNTLTLFFQELSGLPI